MLERHELKSIMDSWKLPDSSLFYCCLLLDLFEASRRPLSLFRIIFQSIINIIKLIDKCLFI